MPIILYRCKTFWVALGIDSLVIAALLKTKIKVAHKDKTVAHYIAFHFDGSQEELAALIKGSTGLSVKFK